MIRSSFDKATGVVTLSLDRAEKKNAMTPSMLYSLLGEVRRVRDYAGVRAVLLTGEGDTFCAGFDLVMCRDDDAILSALLNELSHVARALRRLPMPVVAAVQGSAIAGGCAILGGADIIVTHDAAKFGYPVVRLGISPAVTAPLLRLSLSDGPTRERLLGGTLFSGKEAVALGLAHESIANAEGVVPRAKKIAEEMAQKPLAALAATKMLLGEIDGSSRDAMLDQALKTSLELANSDEQKRLLTMFLDKSLKNPR